MWRVRSLPARLRTHRVLILGDAGSPPSRAPVRNGSDYQLSVNTQHSTPGLQNRRAPGTGASQDSVPWSKTWQFQKPGINDILFKLKLSPGTARLAFAAGHWQGLHQYRIIV